VTGDPEIFVTIGSMFPFDRLVRAMDAWAATRADPPGMLAQIGDGGYEPRHMRWVRSLPREDYARVVAGARLVVAHAGMGSVISAGEHGKPIVLLPRRAARGEHTNDHQVDTARWLHGRPGIHVAGAEAELGPRIAEALAGGRVASLAPTAPAEFLARIRRFAEAGKPA
jgi:UDP-N-acetylglucosamine transferase subunit ALG13